MKKFPVICVLLLTAISICFAGGSRQRADTGSRNITVILYGDKTDRMAEYMANDLPAYTRQRGLNINVDLQVLSWSDYAGVPVELRYASGEDFITYTDPGFMARCISRGYILDLTDLISRHGPNLRREVDASSFDVFSFNRRNYALPLGNKPNASEFYAVTVRQDILEEVGMREIRTIEDLEQFYTEGIKRYPGYFGFGDDGGPTDTYGAARMLSRYISDKNMFFLNELVFTDASADDDRLYSYFESTEFRNYAAIARRWNRMGIIDQQLISDANIATSKWLAGQAFFEGGNAGRAWEQLGAVRNYVPTAKFKTYFMGDARGRPLVSRGTYSTAMQVSANARYPEAYVEFFNLLYADQQSYDFMTYGVRGVDYELDSGGRISSRKTSQVFIPDWASFLTKWHRFETFIPDDVINDYRNWNDGAILQKDIGFIFDVEPVRVEYAQIQGVVNEFIAPIALGFVEYDAAYPEFLRRFKNAGIDRYMAEYQRQFSAFYRNK